MDLKELAHVDDAAIAILRSPPNRLRKNENMWMILLRGLQRRDPGFDGWMTRKQGEETRLVVDAE
ncbi:MAG: hypothetical protein H7315_21195 [Herminiimonas sp.]|nr:hypothetical protein [Herminiimonas sp.]